MVEPDGEVDESVHRVIRSRHASLHLKSEPDRTIASRCGEIEIEVLTSAVRMSSRFMALVVPFAPVRSLAKLRHHR